jgi:D-aspartate ligase
MIAGERPGRERASAGPALRVAKPGPVNPPAVILGGSAIAVPVARSLGAAGVRVYALGAPVDPVRFSRFCHRYVDVGSDDDRGERHLEWLLNEGPAGAVVIPCADDGLELVARHHDLLTDHGLRPLEANHVATLAMLDKDRTHRIARELGIATPRTVTLGGANDLDRAAAVIGFPSALKPVWTYRYRQHFDGKLMVVHDREELEEAYRQVARHQIEALVTEIVPGPDDHLIAYFSYLDEHSEPLLHFVSRKFRQYPNGFGSATYAINGWDQEVAELGLRFLRGAGVRGISYTEFKRDARTGELKLVECNNRLTIEVRSVPHDVPLFAYNRMVGRPAPPLRSQRATRLWDPIRDVQSLLHLRRRKELTVRQWARSLRPPLNFHVFRVDDPMPTIAHFWSRRQAVARKLRLAVGKSGER